MSRFYEDVVQFTLSGYLDDEAAGIFIEQLQVADMADPTSLWFILLNSEGGDIEAGSAIYDAVRLYSRRGSGTHEVTICAVGQCCSMATLVIQAADLRQTTELTTWMFHDLSTNFEEKRTADIRDELTRLERWSDLADTKTVERSSITLIEYRSLISERNWWMSGKSAVDAGFADELV